MAEFTSLPNPGPRNWDGERLGCATMVTDVSAPGILPPGQRVYAVGDVHGCLEQLHELHAGIAADLARQPVDAPLLVHLGDYIDRGPDSAGVIEYLRTGAAPGLPPMVNLVGNHEEMLLGGLAGNWGDAQTWMANGGVAALQSWGVPPRTDPRAWPKLLPASHQAFLRNLAVSHAAGSYLFVHAGIRPGVPLARQSRHDMLWIREPFLSSDAVHPGVVVHGHTPEDRQPVVRHNRIGLDTGAVMGGVLTCAVLQADRLRFLSV
jgi:serine/threonine protein phosphatase 1